ncbi:MAG: hypothetical protein ABEH80_08440, partial [Halobaculum sp.]
MTTPQSPDPVPAAAVLAELPTPVVAHDSDDVVVYANDALCDRLRGDGTDEDRLDETPVPVGESVTDLLVGYDPSAESRSIGPESADGTVDAGEGQASGPESAEADAGESRPQRVRLAADREETVFSVTRRSDDDGTELTVLLLEPVEAPSSRRVTESHPPPWVDSDGTVVDGEEAAAG